VELGWPAPSPPPLPLLSPLPQNLSLVEAVKALAASKGITPGQLALAWVHSRGPDVFPIPGTKRTKWVGERGTEAGSRS
jgi:aryl-alcohol dehydrogenase-like predicted oxidoreductase